MKFLDSTGLGVLWNKIKSSFLSLNGGGVIKGSGDISSDEGNIMIDTTHPDFSRISISGRTTEYKNQDLFDLYVEENAAYMYLKSGEQGAIMNTLRFDPSALSPNEVIQLNGEPLIDGITTSELNSILV